ncbi:MAG TPA: hypothetical protein VE397_02450 [Stellaceae bacterium]|nr:hypothetical protein [Stellaceae bacterium]
MDEESVGLLGVLLIVTALVMSQTALSKPHAAPLLPALSWADVVSVFSCGHRPGEICTLAMSE